MNTNNLDLNVTDEDIDCVMQNIWQLEVCGLPKNHSLRMRTWGENQFGCKTVACAWGTAFYKVNNELTHDGPSGEWINTPYRKCLERFFGMSFLTNDEAKIVYDSIDKDGRGFDVQYLKDNLDGVMYERVWYKIPSELELD